MESTVGWDAAGSCSLWVENTLLEGGSMVKMGVPQFSQTDTASETICLHDATFISIPFALKNGWLHVLPLGTKINVNSSSTKASCVCWLKETEETGGWLHSLLGLARICKYPSLISTPGRVLHPGNCPAVLQKKTQAAFPRSAAPELEKRLSKPCWAPYDGSLSLLPLSSDMPLCMYPWGWLWHLGHQVSVHSPRTLSSTSCLQYIIRDVPEEGAQMTEEQVWQCHHCAG